MKNCLCAAVSLVAVAPAAPALAQDNSSEVTHTLTGFEATPDEGGLMDESFIPQGGSDHIANIGQSAVPPTP